MTETKEEARKRKLEEAKERARKSRADFHASKPGKKTFSKVSNDGSCPKCGGQSFKRRRGRFAKTTLIPTFAIGLLFTPKHILECKTCGERYERG